MQVANGAADDRQVVSANTELLFLFHPGVTRFSLPIRIFSPLTPANQRRARRQTLQTDWPHASHLP
jgi:hypothetical protein